MEADISYLTGSFGWDAALQFIQTPQGHHGCLRLAHGTQSSGTGFDQLNVRLVAGEVNRIQPPIKRK